MNRYIAIMKKYMLSAVPLMRYLGDDVLKERIRRSVEIVLSAQQSDGYIGTYRPDCRAGEGWDVWGMKYTMMGLLHYVDVVSSGLGVESYELSDKGTRALEAAKKLCKKAFV